MRNVTRFELAQTSTVAFRISILSLIISYYSVPTLALFRLELRAHDR